jgi:hypothetical protein
VLGLAVIVVENQRVYLQVALKKSLCSDSLSTKSIKGQPSRTEDQEIK